MALYKNSSGNLLVRRTKVNSIWTPNPIQDGPPALHGAWFGDPQNGLVTGLPANNAVLGSWHNFGIGSDFTNTGSTARPTFQTASTYLNGRPAARFVRTSNQHLQTDIADISTPYWVVTIAASYGPAGTTEVIAGTGFAGSSGIGKAGSSNGYYCAGDATVLQSGISWNTGVPVLLVSRINGSLSQLRVNTTLGTQGQAGTGAATMLKAGAGGANTGVSNFWTGDMHFIAIYTSDPQLDPRWKVIQYMALDCGVASV